MKKARDPIEVLKSRDDLLRRDFLKASKFAAGSLEGDALRRFTAEVSTIFRRFVPPTECSQEGLDKQEAAHA